MRTSTKRRVRVQGHLLKANSLLLLFMTSHVLLYNILLMYMSNKLYLTVFHSFLIEAFVLFISVCQTINTTYVRTPTAIPIMIPAEPHTEALVVTTRPASTRPSDLKGCKIQSEIHDG